MNDDGSFYTHCGVCKREHGFFRTDDGMLKSSTPCGHVRGDPTRRDLGRKKEPGEEKDSGTKASMAEDAIRRYPFSGLPAFDYAHAFAPTSEPNDFSVVVQRPSQHTELLREALAMLRDVEWKGMYGCPFCWRTPNEIGGHGGHWESCDLASILNRAEAALA